MVTIRIVLGLCHGWAIATAMVSTTIIAVVSTIVLAFVITGLVAFIVAWFVTSVVVGSNWLTTIANAAFYYI